MSERTIGFDLDGVLARPAAYFVNFAAIFAGDGSSRAWEPPRPGFGAAARAVFSRGPVHDEGEIAPESPAAGPRVSGLRSLTEGARYALRFPTADAKAILSALQPLARLVLLTNRNAANQERLERWLAAKGLKDYFEGVHLNDSGEPGTQFKLRRLMELGITEYVEDNPDIADHLARNEVQVYFRAWRGVRRPRHPSVIAFRSADELLTSVRGFRP
ncbi:MAG: hypothetical protein WEB00_12430 [Dehalococcoidia bacterium]